MVKDIKELLLDLKNRGVKLWVEEGRLRSRAPEGAMTPDVRNRIRLHLDEIVILLQGVQEKTIKAPIQSILKTPEQASYPLSNAQRRLWVLDQLEESHIAYNMPSAIRLKGKLDREAFQAAFKLLADRHESLRTTFVSIEGTPRQIIHSQSSFELKFTEWEKENSREQLADYISNHAQTSFDLTSNSLLKVEVICLEEEEHMVLFNMHHIISDGWSMEILVRELGILYNAFTKGEMNPLAPLRIQYKDYAAWQNALLQDNAKMEELRNYWHNKLISEEGHTPLLDLPADFPRPAIKTYRGANLSKTFDAELLGKLEALSKSYGATLFMTLTAIVKILLYRYSGQRDILIGSPSAGRTHVDLHDQIGFYVNTLVLRDEVKAGAHFSDFLAQVKQTCLEAFEHELYPFDRLVEELELARDMSRSPLFDVMLVLQNTEQTELKLGDLTLLSEPISWPVSKFDLLFNFTTSVNGLSLGLEYNTDLYKADRIERLFAHLECLIESVLANPKQDVGELNILPEVERQLILHEFNDTKVVFPAEKTIVDLFEEQVEQTPDEIAIIFENKKISYRQLNEKANRIGHYLRTNYGIKEDDIVGLLPQRTEWMLIGILGILKSGAAYLPLSEELPARRLEYMLRDSGAKLLLAEEYHRKLGQQIFSEVVVLEELNALQKANPKTITRPEHLAYVLYTSGSTGQPKGVEMPHQPLVNLVSWHIDNSSCGVGSRTMQSTTFSFDVSFQEVFVTWLSGGTLVMVGKTVRKDLTALAQLISREKIERVFLPFAALQELAQILVYQEEDLSALQVIITAGEQLQISEAIVELFKKIPACTLKNHYGPTEAHVVSEYILKGDPSGWMSLPPIGKPIANAELYILDDNLQPVPIGVPGGLYIGGVCLSKGYLKRSDLTGERFLAHPLREGERLYKTGDLGRWLPDGNIEFLGRKDHQLKIRGYRVELGEVEHQLLQHPAISACVVLGKKIEGVTELVAYLTAKADNVLDTGVLRSFTKEHLPDYMIPTYFVELERFPLTNSGKVNRKALPEPQGSSLSSGVDYVAPRNQLEQTLVNIWESVLKREDIGINDNFFDLGGHSLRAIRTVSSIQKQLSAELRLRDVFAHPTIADLASIISNKKSIEFKAIEPVAIQSDYALSNAQRRLWVLDQLEENHIAYNMPAAIRLKGKLNKEALESAFKWLTDRHESLRTTFVSIDGTPRQIVNAANNFELKFTDWQPEKSPEQLTDYISNHTQTPFDLTGDSLLKVELIRRNDEEHIMLFNMHHIISDGWSMEILVREFGILYNAFAKGEANPLTPLRIQYKDYAAWQNALLQDNAKMEEFRNYWHNKLMPDEGSIPTLNLPTDFPRPAIKSYRGANLSKTFDTELLAKIETLSESCGATLFMTLTALVKVLLYRYSGQRDILIGSPSAGRTHADLQNQIGFYVNTLVLRDEIEEGIAFNNFLALVKQTCLEAFEHELYPFDQLVEELDLDRDLSRSPLFDVMVVLQNNEQTDLALGDLAISVEPTSWAVSKFDLTFNFSTSSDGLTLDLEYNTDLYKADRMERLLTHFECLIESVFAKQKQDVAELNILPETERQLILHDFNATHADFPSDQTIIDLFEEQVEKTPDNIAVVFEDKELTYRQLNEKANQLGHYLLEHHHIQPDDIIALQLEQSEWMLIAILGAMKAGGAYLPIAPDFPENRVAYILEDSTAKLLLTDNHTYNKGKTYEKSLPVIVVEDVSHAQNFNPVIFTHSRNLAYVIYTSGSTGQPKGVMVEHKGVNNLIGNLDKNVFRQYGAIQKMGLVASYTFDASIQLLFGSILYGHSLFIIPEKLKIDGQLFSAFLQDNQIDIIDCTPRLLAILLEGGWQKAKEILINHLFIGGEVLPIKLLHDFYRDSRHHHIKMSNVYGPTEATVEVSLFNIDKSILGTNDSVPIGKPMSNCTMYILEKGQKLSPVGIPGELHIGGVGLGRGYLNNKKLTEEKFIPHPFVEGERIYKTGDLARWLPDGNIEFLGRIDHQLKIRGYRIEAGEIEQVLLQHPDIQSCVVIGKELEGNKELVAYLVRQTETVPDVLTLRSFLSESLPDYMIPAHFVELETLPLTSSNKVDRKSLPEPEGLGIASGVAYAAPQTQMEILLTEVWKEVLRQPSISIHDNFFHIGGDSIKAIQISGRLGSRGWTLSIRDLFAHPNIAELALKITTKKEEYPQGLQRGNVPLTAIQSWFFAQELPHPHHFNQAVSLSSEERLDVVVLEKSLQGLLGHHDLLRARYESSAGVVIQNISDSLVLDFEVIAISNADEEAGEITRISTAAQVGFELEKGPLLKAVLFQKENGDELLLVIHHLVVDGVSWRILIEDLTQAYRQLMSGKTIQLSPKTAPFSWWAEKIIAFSNGTLANAQYEYWKGVLSQAVSTIKTDHPQQANKFGDSRSVQFRLNKENTEALFQQSNQAYHTEINDILLTALSRALKQTFGGDAYRITLEGHGRESIFAMDISRTVGWFTSMFPVVLNYEASTGYHLQSIKENLHRIPDKGVVYGLLRYLSEDKYTLLENSGISFNYLGTFAQGDTDSFFRFSKSNIGPGISPDNSRPYELDVSGILVGEELQLSVTYGSQRIDEARMEALIAALENALMEIIVHCTAQEESQLTPCDFTACGLSLEAYHEFISANDLDPSKIEDIYPLSPMQEGMLFHKLLDPDSVAYFVQMDIGLSGEIDENLFRDCWQQVLDAHPVLRTSFYTDGLNRPLQVVNKDVEIAFVTKDISHLGPEDQGQYIKTCLKEDEQKGFELKEKSLIRFALMAMGSGCYRLIMSNHHIIVDGWSLPVLFKDFLDLYEAGGRSTGISPKLYAPFIAWLEKQTDTARETFWRNYLAGYEEVSGIPGLKTSIKSAAIEPGEEVIKLSKAQTVALEQLARSSEVSLNTVVQGIWAVILGIYNQKEAVVFGMTSSGRSALVEGIEQMAGLFINTIPVRIDLRSGESFTGLLKQIQQSSLSVREYEHYSLARIQSLWEGEGDLFDHIVVFENYPVDEALGKNEGGLRIVGARSYETIHYGFGIIIAPGRELNIRLTYNKAVLSSQWVKRIKTHIETAITNITAHPAQLIGEIDILPQAERQLILHDFNDTQSDFPANKTIVDLFEEQVEKTPDNVAVVFENKELTYRQLNERANRLGHYLIERHNIQPDDIVALQLERSEWMIVAILGVMKAGGAYLPVAPDLPKSRVAYMLEDSAAKLLLTDKLTLESAGASKDLLPVVVVEEISYTNRANPVLISIRNLAYVIYTSGSTGRPKGTMLEHRGAVNMALSQIRLFDITAKDRILQFSTYTFDAFVFESLTALLSGAALVVINEEVIHSPASFLRFVSDKGLSVMLLPPAYLNALNKKDFENIRVLVTGGEAAHLGDALHYGKKLNYFNAYGPTECSVIVCVFNMPKVGYSDVTTVPIGRPIDNIQILLLDKQHNLVPIGIPGELLISGTGLARGYLNNKTLTAEKFISHPFLDGERLYKTGDLARWLPDGNIEFLGRIDHQLKIRGYRIEAGEIEQALLQHPDIQSCVVIDKEVENGKELAAYLVGKTDAIPDVLSLRSFLSESLPDYMIPAYFVELENLPLTSSGKVNRKALPEPDGLGIASGVAYVAPQTKMEILLTEVWKEVLRQQSISIHDNFFHIGGDSIKAIQISGRLGAQGWSLSIRDLFAHPTIALLAPKITTKKQEYPQGLQSGKVPLTAIQNWFFEQGFIHPHHFNQAIGLSSKERLDVVVLEQSLHALLAQHDLLRAIYETKDGIVVQHINEAIALDFEVVPIKKIGKEAQEITRLSTEAQAGFDLEKGPLLKAILFQKETGDELLLVIHHLVVDGVSWRIIIEDLTHAYRQLLSGKTIRLSPKTAPFSWWAEKVIDFSNSTVVNAQYDYWSQILSRSVSTIKVDYPDQSNKVGDSTSVQFRLNKEKTEALLQQANQAYHTEINDILLTALSRALKQAFGGDAYQITLEGHGREAIFDMDISRTVGWFTTMFPVVLHYEESTGYHIQVIKENLRRIPDKGIVYGLLRYLSEGKFTAPENSAISFNYLGTFAQGDTQSLFQFSDSNTGDSVSPLDRRQHELDVSGILTGEELQLSIVYSSERIEEMRMETLIANFETALLEIIGHCTAQEERRLTPCDFTACDLSLTDYNDFVSANNLSPAQIDDIYPLSPMQEGMLFHKLLDRDSVAYFVQMDLGLTGSIDESRFRDCWQQVLDAHPILRTSFHSEGLSRPLQVVHKDVEVSFETEDILNLDPVEQEEFIRTYLKTDEKKGFDLKEKSLIRFALIQTGAEEFRLIMTNHHIILDGWSLPILFKDFMDLYEGAGNSAVIQPKLYAPFISWLEKQTDTARETFWRNYLAGYEEVSGIPGLKTSIKSAAIEPGEEVIKLSKAQTVALEQLARSSEVSLNTVVQGIWAVILGIYNQKEAVVFGMTSSGRSALVEDIEQMTGLFINTIPVRINLQSEESFPVLLKQIQQSSLSVREYEHYSLARIQSLWEGQGDLFDHILVFENYPVDEAIQKNGGSIRLAGAKSYETIHYGFGLVIAPGSELTIRLTYNKAVLSSQWVERIKTHIETTIDNLTVNPAQLIGEINILPEAERQLILHEFNDTQSDFSSEKTIVDLFEEQVEKTPDNIAVVFEDSELTYRQLNKKANQLGHYLIERHNIQPDDIVALQLERSEWMIIAILGVLKAGGAYLPIDETYPQERKAFIAEDSNYKICIDNKELRKYEESRESYGNKNVEVFVKAKSLAYVIYTSGSTGKPKGVLVPHQGVVRLSKMSNLPLDETTIVLQLSTLSFDAATFEIWCSLLNGGKLILYPYQQVDLSEVNRAIKENAINTIWFTSALFDKWVYSGVSGLSLRFVLSGGDVLNPLSVSYLYKQIPKVTIINGYGPTENTTFTCCYTIPVDYDFNYKIPIGSPIYGTDVYILDNKNSLCPIGVIGELCTAGLGLSLGYLNKPELTEEKFIPHLYKAGERLYKTGDLARWLPDGNIEFLGRIDRQLKIRGYRIEAGEIEQLLLQHPDIHSCVVIGKELEGSKELVAYLVSKTETIPDIITLRSFLSESLPDYMIPAYFIELETLPLTQNGKVNRKALPEPDGFGIDSGTVYVAPRNQVEQALVDIWEELLKREKIGVHDNFFDLGGHSLRAIRLVSLIQQRLSAELKLREVFAQPTIAGLASAIISKDAIQFEAIESVAVQSDYALSNAQRRLWVLDQLEESHIAYNMPSAIRLKGKLDREAFQSAFKLLIDRHESLRTTFVSIEGTPRQIIHSQSSFELKFIEWGKENSREQLADYISNHAQTSFDLTSDSLLKVEVICLEEEEHMVLFNMHHIISDGWSMEILVRELGKLYNAFTRGEMNPLAPLRIQYKDYAAWQNALLQDNAKMEELRNYWHNKLISEEGHTPLLDLPADFPRPAIKTYRGANLSKTFDAELLGKLEALSKSYGATLFMTMTAIVKILLYRYSGQRDILIGSPSAGRTHVDLHDQFGFYVNTLVLRDEVKAGAHFSDFLAQVKQTCLEAFERELYPFDRLVEELDLARDMSRSPLFDVMLVLQNNEQTDLTLGDLTLSTEPTSWTVSKFDLTFHFSTDTNGLTLGLEYNTDLYKADRIERLFAHLECLMQSVLVNSKQEVAELNILPETERRLILNDFNETKNDFPTDQTIIELFEEQVEKTPDNIAVVIEGKELTYRQLNEQANQLGHYLRNTYRIQPDDIVALELERSEWMIITILGVLKTGGAYLPIDQTYPQERKTFIAKDSNYKVCIDNQELKKYQESRDTYPNENMEVLVKAKSLAYVIYTSGSTGRPKGVLVPHQGVVRLSKMTNLPLNETTTILQLSSMSFDAATFEIWCSILNGGRLVLYPHHQVDLSEVNRVIKENVINTIWLTAALFDKWVYSGVSNLPLRFVLSGGDVLNPLSVSYLYQQIPEATIINGYGPTENTTFTCCFKIPISYNFNQKISIGSPIGGTQVYILDRKNTLCPIGVIGELCTAGLGLSLGYLNNPELTEEKFISHPFNAKERLYKTGDLARWLPDGNIEFLGRRDHQLKIRGYRVEAGEIEQALLQHPDIQSCVVIGKELEASKELVAYLVSKTENALNVLTLRNFLSESLPDYMIPAYFLELEALPITENGKVNRKALPEPDGLEIDSGVIYVAPRNQVEQTLVDIWEEILKRKNIGIHDNFFDLGGHSLRAIRLVTLIQRQLFAKLKLREIFAQPTIADLASVIFSKDAIQFEAIEPVAVQSDYALSNAQRRLWVLDQLEENQVAYNMPSAIRLEGKLDKTALQTAFSILLNRHESLRTVFVSIEGTPRQIISDADTIAVVFTDWQLKNDREKLRDHISSHAGTPFDLTSGPLIKIEVVCLTAEEHVMLFNMHHIISDGWSMEILVRELGILYEACTKGKSNPLAPLHIQYKDYAAWQNNLLRDNTKMEGLRDYWYKKLIPAEGDIVTLDLPADYQRPPVKTYRGASISKTFAAEQLGKLEALSKSYGATLFMTLTAIVKILLYRYSGQRDILMGSPSAGRTHVDLHDQIGFYVNTLVLRDEVKAGAHFSDFLAQVKQTCLEAFEHELYPFDRLVEELDLARDLSRSPLFDVMLVLQNNEQSDLTLGDLALSTEPITLAVSKFDLLFNFTTSVNGLGLDLEYNTDLYKADRMERLFTHLECLIESAIENPTQTVDELKILPQAERQLILHEFNDTKVVFPAEKTIVDLFEEQVEQTPDEIAIIFENKKISYRQLNEKANRIGHYLRTNYGIKEDDIVGLLPQRTEWMLIGILGILKSGAAYLPLSEELPARRLEYMLRDSGAKLLLAEEHHRKLGQQIFSEVVVLEELNALQKANPKTITRPEHLAYVLYTSGSTGQPKGVEMPHQPLVNLVSWHIDNSSCGVGSRTMQSTTFSFDVSFQEVFVTWLSGGTLVMVGKTVRKDLTALAQLISREKIERVFLPFAALQELAQILVYQEEDLSALQVIITAGEQLQISEAIVELFKKIPACTLKNHYGPTEAHVVSEYILKGDPSGWMSLPPIGKPIANAELYILDDNLQPVPIGVPGGLYIGGVCLSKGYLKRSDLTGERFLAHPLREGERLYKTGDLGRWLPDGNIEFLGRKDHQLKIRGYRVELGEVEHQLLQHPAISACVVLGKKIEGVTELVAYLTAKADNVLDTGVLRSFTKEHLPDYMIPTYFVELERFPLTNSGKVNRKALPEPQGSSLSSGVDYVAPRNQLEQTLVNIWESVLKREDIGINDNFFDLGGHSLRAIRLCVMMTEEFNLNVPLQLLFQHPAIAALAKKITESREFESNYHYKEGLRFNPGGTQTIFAFPAFFGLSIGYQELAAFCPETTWYSFDFLEAGNRLEIYYEQIKQEQAEGPYVFFGHSAGGNLAFEMALFMEEKGDIVSDLILGDCSFRLSPVEFNFKEYLEEIENENLTAAERNLLGNKIVIKQIERRVTAYHNFLNAIKMDVAIQANIHQLLADEKEEMENVILSKNWKPFTKGSFVIYLLQGIHREIFASPNLPYNTTVLNNILSKIQDRISSYQTRLVGDVFNGSITDFDKEMNT